MIAFVILLVLITSASQSLFQQTSLLENKIFIHAKELEQIEKELDLTFPLILESKESFKSFETLQTSPMSNCTCNSTGNLTITNQVFNLDNAAIASIVVTLFLFLMMIPMVVLAELVRRKI